MTLSPIGRLDVVLAQCARISRGEARRWLAAGLVTVNGRRVGEADKGRMLSPQDALQFDADTAHRIVPRPDLPLSVLASGPGWVVVDKPAGQGVHPLDATQTDTALNALAAQYPCLETVGERGLRGGVVHRLDVDTTGCLAFALDDKGYAVLHEAFQGPARSAKKTYLAWVAGRFQQEGLITMDLVIRRHAPAFVGMAAPGETGRRTCRQTVRILEHHSDRTRVEVDLDTGFLHQIRAIFAAMGHSLVGDVHYGGPATAPRPLLHAWKLEIPGLALNVEAPIPSDMQILRSDNERYV